MGIRQKVFALTVLVAAMFLGCENTFQTASINLYGIKLTDVVAHSAAAYYLSEDGTLYCTGADSDAASFVAYKNPPKGIVAENVKYFFEILDGGAYIDLNDDLYIWNNNTLPLLNYFEKPGHQRILENIKFADSSKRCMIYIDIHGDLYLAGVFLGEEYTLNQPLLLGNDVISADIQDNNVLWVDADGVICCYGTMDTDTLSQLNEKFSGTNVIDIRITRNYVLLLSNHELWFYGDYEQLISGKPSFVDKLVCLKQDINQFSCSYRTVGSIDSGETVLVWGRCIANDAAHTKQDEYVYCEAREIAQKASSVFVSDASICYVDINGASRIFHSKGYPEFYGNSTNDLCVGIERTPCTWVPEQ